MISLQNIKVFILPALLSLALTACMGGSGGSRAPMPGDGELPRGDQGGSQKVGKPYKIAGQWYYPKVEPNYDEVGLASWYGKDFHGKPTANGETFNMNSLTAAHKTLPLPTFVKVTNLVNGRTLILRVNDRGPFVGDRLIDISRRGAQLLGFQKQGVTKVRVQAVDDYGRVKSSSRSSRNVAQDMRRAREQAEEEEENRQRRQAEKQAEKDAFNAKREEYERKLAAKMQAEAGDPNVRMYVQIGAYSAIESAKNRANDLRSKAGQNPNIVRGMSAGREIWRVRVGPFIKKSVAERILDRILDSGFDEARIFTEHVQ